MKEEDKKDKIKITDLFSIIPSLSLLFSIIYIFGFSQTSSIRLISLMKIDDFVIATLSWLIPSSIIFCITFIIGIIDSKIIEPDESNNRKTKTKWKVFTNSGTFHLTLMTLVVSLAIIVSKTLSIINLIFFVLITSLTAFLEFGPNTRSGAEFFKLIPRKYFDLFYITVFGIILAYTNGLESGRNGDNLFLSEHQSTIQFIDNDNEIKGKITYSVGDFFLIYTADDNKPILLQKSIISKIIPCTDSLSTTSKDINETVTIDSTDIKKNVDSH